MHADHKLAVAVRTDLAVWQKVNVTAFVVSGLGATDPDLVGEPYVDADGQRYLPMFVQPVLVCGGDGPALTRAFTRARARDLAVAVHTDDLFATGNDVDNRAAVAKVATLDLALAGFAVGGPRREVQRSRSNSRRNAKKSTAP